MRPPSASSPASRRVTRFIAFSSGMLRRDAERRQERVDRCTGRVDGEARADLEIAAGLAIARPHAGHACSVA